jgi:hypothetical protein
MKWSKIQMLDKKLIKNYTTIGDKILDYFDATIYSYPEPMLHCHWAYWSNEIVWWDREPISESELDSPDYSFQVLGTAFFDKPDYCLAHVDNGCGDNFTILLDTSKRIL